MGFSEINGAPVRHHQFQDIRNLPTEFDLPLDVAHALCIRPTYRRTSGKCQNFGTCCLYWYKEVTCTQAHVVSSFRWYRYRVDD